MKESILQKFIRLFRDIDKEILPNANVLERIYIVFDFLWEKIKYNIELIDYVQYRFYFKRRIERDQFITHGKLLKIIKICNDPKSRIFFDQKPLFNQEFKDYLGRDWLDTKVCSKEEFYSLPEKEINSKKVRTALINGEEEVVLAMEGPYPFFDGESNESINRDCPFTEYDISSLPENVQELVRPLLLTYIEENFIKKK